MNNTPIKQSFTNKNLCVVCAEIAKDARKVDSTKLAFNVSYLLLKYGGIIIESGSICRKCIDKLFGLHKKTKLFFEQCQKTYWQNVVVSKRMAPGTPDSRPSKRLDMSKTPKSIKVTKIPTKISKTPVSKTRQCLFESSNEKKSKSKDQGSKSRTRLDFLKTSPMDNISVGMEVEVGDSTFCARASTEIIGDPLVTTTPKKQKQGSTNVSSSENEKCSSSRPHTEHGYTKSKREPRKSNLNKQENSKEASFIQPDTHDYIKSHTKRNKFSESYEEIRSFMKEYNTDQKIDINNADRKSIISACVEGSPETICKAIMSVKGLKKQIIGTCNDELDKQVSTMQNRKYNTSVLMQKTSDHLKGFDWFTVINEFKQSFPDLMIQLLSLMVKQERCMLYTELEKVIPRLGAIYGILMQGRNNELSLIQRLNSMLLSDNICDQKVFDRLHRQGLCLGYEGSQYMLTITGGKFNDSVINLVKDKKRFRLIGDNINWTVDVHDQRVDHRSRMYHAFGSAILVQNIDFTSTPDVYPQRQFHETPHQDFIPSEDDYKLYKRDYTVLMSRVVFRHLPYFQRFEDVVPAKLSQPCDNNLATKTKVIPLPVLYKNEQKYQDVVGILDFYEDIIVDACTKTEQNLEDVRIHIGGDQLTRERFSGAKSLRAHEDTPVARFENLSPITFEFFHMHMNFLKMAYSTLFTERSAQDNGTLKSLQNRISRSNVGENVASHYDADKDFFISVVDVYIVECFMDFFGMEEVNSAPTKNMPPDFENNDDKKRWYNETVGRLVDQYVLSSSLLGQTRSETVIVDGKIFNLDLPDGRKLEIKLPDENKQTEKADSVENYAKRVLELGLLFKDLLDATKLPEQNRHISLLKMSMLLFKIHKNLSKYAFEILRFLVHQICILSERAAKEEFYGLFVNTNGHSDVHIPADRRMEYLVKKVKKHIKHMYSNKTEKNVNLRTSTIAAISDIGERYDDVSNVVTRTQRHPDRSVQGDEMILLESLRMLRPFNTTPGRSHFGFPNFAKSSVDGLDVQHYHEWIRTRKYNFAVEKGN